MDIPQSRLEEYKDFVGRYSVEGRYVPELAIGGLLCSLTPDPKIVLLHAMNDEEIYCSKRSPHRACLSYLEHNDLDTGLFPIKDHSVLSYLKSRDVNAKIYDGSLVETGAVEKIPVDMGKERKDGYRISSAGKDLIRSVGAMAADFVFESGKGKNPPKFNSMWKIFSSAKSVGNNNRPLNVYRIVKFLHENPGKHRYTGIWEFFDETIPGSTVSDILNSLGKAGIIDYSSPGVDNNGKRTVIRTVYSLKNPGLLENAENPDLLKGVENILKQIGRNNFSKVVNFIRKNPESYYESKTLSEEIGLKIYCISKTLSFLSRGDVGCLQYDCFKPRKVLSEAKANYFTEMLYDTVLMPAEEMSRTLKPVNKTLKPLGAEELLKNYQEERTHFGPNRGEEMKMLIMHVLRGNGGEIKLSHIKQECNHILSKDLGTQAYLGHVNKLIKYRFVERSRRGFYKVIE